MMPETIETAQHPFLRALTGDGPAAALAGPLPREDELDSVQHPESTCHVLDADASQRLCLEAAARGYSFVMLGPEGSGKSQTIVNMIAEGIARGKSVLVVSDKPDAISGVLGSLGLDGGAEGSAGSPAAVAPAASDHARLKHCRERLHAYSAALHSVRKPLDRSVWSAMEEVVGLRAVPTYPLGLALSRAGFETAENLTVITEVTPSWLEEALGAVRRLQQLWFIRAQEDFPWRGFKAERYNKQLRDDVAGTIDRVRARLERVLSAAEHYGQQIGCQEPVARLLKIGEMLESAPVNLCADWLRVDLATLTQELERCADEYQRLGKARGPLTARYGPEIWKLAEGTSAAVERAWKAAAPLLRPGDERGAGLLAHQQALRGWAADTQRRFPGWLTEARVLEKWLAVALPRGQAADADQSKPDPSPLHLRHLQRLANLCMSEYPPERAWVHQAKALEDARTLIAAARPVFADYHQRRRQLMEVYTEGLFDLELERLGAAFEGPYRGWLRVLKGQFRRDRRAVRRRTHTLVVPPTMAQDMIVARDLVLERRRLEQEGATRKPVLGRYERGLDTNFEAAERATRVAAEAVEIIHQLAYASLPARFLDVLCAGTPPPEKIRAAAKRLHDSLGAWQHETQALKAFLPMEALPGTGQPLEETALTALGQYAKDLQAGLNQFAALTDPVLARAPARPEDTAALVADLRQAEEARFFETAHATEEPRWQARLGPGFQGVATNWDALKKALTWVQRVRAFFHDGPPQRFAEAAAAAPAKRPPLHELRAALEQYEQALHGLEHRFESPGLNLAGKRPTEHAPETVKQWLGQVRERVAELADWVDWQHLPSRLGRLGLGAFWEELNKNPPVAEEIPNILLKSFWSSWLDAAFQQDAVLAGFSRTEHEKLTAEFGRLDRAWLQANVQLVGDRLKAAESKPYTVLSPTEAALLPGGAPFDLLLVDDADKIPLEDILEIVARGKQVILAGGDELSAEGDQNIIAACKDAGLPTHGLRFRYGHRAAELAAAGNDSPVGPIALDILEFLQARGRPARVALTCGDFLLDIGIIDPEAADRQPLAIDLDGPAYHALATTRDRERLRPEFLQRHGWRRHRIWAPDWLYRRDQEIERLCQVLEDGDRGRGTL